MSILTYKQIELLDELNYYNIYKSPLIHAWDNNIILKDRPLLFCINQQSKLLFSFSNIFKDYTYISYKNNKFIKNRKNIIDAPHYNYLIRLLDKKIGLLVIDLETYINTKNLLLELHDYIDEDTVIFMPYLVNFENFDIKSIRGLFEFIENKNLKLQWIGINGDLKLYDFKDNGYNNGVSFKLINE